ncbi:uncharacterized protein L969DRAFT_87222 [Mixia osmundae IAM 14324]|uniref:Metal-dependent protein hydrolase n=1 Tax=Mixia osmundae (strain CBS 9802 / IAM 14324 / JCM 22182 / KY 12970) TaxID=764103 RepID=G7DZQ3_MIXOS|nr:uncharacterized protein L969DRAFT_87222 [Mixia osmundae IAM 14324]KEI39278.1 hypothetical protein L969DRAFT_87222 [Mixia osmundae IAM 14324]GAA96063.1 hypothetical protein E5Q_02724 [Mixia osmundae IAM 14324]
MGDTAITKKARTDGPKLICTHSGTFHADEALAVHLVRTLPDYKDARLVRTRDPAIIDMADIVLDVGGVYSVERQRFDHHQRGFAATFDSSHRTKLSSAGLVYKHYGKQIIAQRLGLQEADKTVSTLYPKVYEDFVEGLDGIDNGINQYEAVLGGDVRSNYRNFTGLSSRISRLNPSWNETSNNDILDERFETASALAGSEFFQVLDAAAHQWLPGRSLIVEALFERCKFDGADPHGRIMLLGSFAPWKDHLFRLERELSIEDDRKVLYVIYPDEAGKWRVQAVPRSSEGFESRKALPAAWRGIRDKELDALVGIEGCVFVHAAGFIGGHATREGALIMANKAIAA